MKIIGLSGLAGSGKTTVADALVLQLQESGDSARRMSFADPLKAMLATYYAMVGLTSEQINARISGSLKQIPDPYLQAETPRYAMQTLGTEWGRQCIGSYFWVSEGLRRAESSGLQWIVFDDVRFEQEARAIGELNFHITRGGVQRQSDHVSEGFAAGPEIINDGLPEDAARKIIRHILDGQC